MGHREPALFLMKLLHDNKDFQKLACAALQNFTHKWLTNQTTVYQTGLLEILYHVINKFDRDSDLQVHGVATIANRLRWTGIPNAGSRDWMRGSCRKRHENAPVRLAPPETYSYGNKNFCSENGKINNCALS